MRSIRYGGIGTEIRVFMDVLCEYGRPLTRCREVQDPEDPLEVENMIGETRMYTDAFHPWAGKR